MEEAALEKEAMGDKRKMTCKEITVAEWNELNYREDTYFANGCIFDEEIDNLIAFSWYKDELHEVGKYYKVVDKFIIPHSKEELAEEWIEKENAELKTDMATVIPLLERAKEISESLTKAKEIIKDLLLVADNNISQMGFQLCVTEAKQFLSEVEK